MIYFYAPLLAIASRGLLIYENMKKHILYLVLLTQCHFLNGQVLISPPPFEKFEAWTSDDGIDIGEYSLSDYLITSENKVLYSTHYSPQFTSFPDGVDFFNDVVEGNYFKLTMINTDLVVEHEWNSGDLNNTNMTVQYAVYLGQTADGIEILGTGKNDTMENDFSIFKITLDNSLDLLDINWFDPPLESISGIYDIIKNQSGNYIMSGFLDIAPSLPKEKFICEFTPDGELLNYRIQLEQWDDTWINDGSFGQMPGGQYIVHPYYIMDGDFNDIALYDGTALIYSASIDPVDSSRFVFGGTGVMLTNNNTELFNFEALCVGHLDGQVDTIFFNSWPNIFVQTYPGIRSISAADTNHIYFATHRDGFFAQEPTYVSLHSVRLDGTVNWSYLFGGDASYTPIDVITMPDGGCLLLAWKLYWQPPIAHTLSDIDYVLFDVDGNVKEVGPSFTKGSFKLQPALVYPNPAKDVIYIEHGNQSADLNIVLYDAMGRVLFSGSAEGGKIDISLLSSGIYFYSLSEGINPIQSGKLVIEK